MFVDYSDCRGADGIANCLLNFAVHRTVLQNLQIVAQAVIVASVTSGQEDGVQRIRYATPQRLFTHNIYIARRTR